MRTVDHLIIGQGVAGTMIAHFLLKENKKILVADVYNPSASSRVAAGIFNPVTGWRMVKTWRVEELFPFAEKTYREIGNLLHQEFYHSKNIYRLFSSIADQNDWAYKRSSANVERYMENLTDDSEYAETINNGFGGFEIRGAGFVDIATLVNEYRDMLGKRCMLNEEKVKYEDLVIEKDGVRWRDILAKKVIFCEGYGVVHNPYFSYLPLNPVKGELLTIHAPGLKTGSIISKGIYIVPLGDQYFRAGATYDFTNIDEEITVAAREELVSKLDSVLKVPYTITGQKAGIRPATKDRRPFLGIHQQHPELVLFNGMGTKGITLAPFFANHLVQSLEHNAPLDREVDIARFK